MRKLIVGLIAVGLVAVAAPAIAQTADPLGLIASGAVIPYVLANGFSNPDGGDPAVGSLSILEIASPVGSNAPPEESVFGARSIHMFFFDQNCVRAGDSVGFSLTTNQATLINFNNIQEGDPIPQAGLVAIGGVDNSFGQNGTLLPFSNPVHARIFWVNVQAGILSRVIDPISIHNPEAISLNAVWNPLRTGATLVAPFEGSGVHSTLYFVCPTQSIAGGSTISTVFPEASDGVCVNGDANCFPKLRPKPVVSGPTPLFLRVFDQEENPRRDIHTTCTCFSVQTLKTLDPIFSNPDPSIGAPDGTFTEIQGDPACLDDQGNHVPCSFTGYRALEWGINPGGSTVGNDLFHRLSNGSFQVLQGLPPININFPNPTFGGNILR